MASQQFPHPQLLPDLRLALACLYNLPHPHQHHPQRQLLTLAQAQEFLIYVQARNIRRKVESMIQRLRDKPQDSAAAVGEPLRPGSSWLASLALLCQRQQPDGDFAASNSERLFAAQTLLHRLICCKLDQSIDWEIEISVEDGIDVRHLLFHQLSHPVPLPQMVEHYQRIMNQYHPFVGSVVSQYNLRQHAEEDCVKGELSILTLTAIIYVTAVASYNNPQEKSNKGPLLNCLGSSVGALALRLRFPAAASSKIATNQPQQQFTPLVSIITQALSLVFQTAGTALHRQASSDALTACLSALPDICIGSSGGARGRISIDPKALQEAGRELRSTGLVLLWELLQRHVQDMQQAQTETQMIHESILLICERWARFLPLPLEFLQHTIPVARQYIAPQQQQQHGNTNLQKAAFAYLVAIFEGATWTPEQILAKAVGVSPEQQFNQQAGKKRQTSKSKKRQQEALQSRATDFLMDEALAEFYHRGSMSCHAAVMSWEALHDAFQSALAEANQHSGEGEGIQIDGEGPIGCLAACANACLPQLLRLSTNPSLAFPQSKDLFVAISETFQQLCQSQHRVIRAFSMETIYSLHKALIEHVLEGEEGQHPPLDAGLQSAIVDFLFNCSMSLATSCGYPDGYFQHMGALSNEELEIERNDVRDVLRTVAVSEPGGSTAFADVTRLPLEVTQQVLARLLHACSDAVQEAQTANRLFPETAVHCFSALAKPLNQLAKCYAKSNQPRNAVDILRLALQIFQDSLRIVTGAFSISPLSELFPVCRVAELAIASLSPMLSCLCTLPVFRDDVVAVLRLSLNTAAVSVAMIPELATPSVLGYRMYDIRGAMRGPGGEDHVGCLAVMRLAFESDPLSRMVIDAAGDDIQQLCHLHSQLKSIEVSREKGTVHGHGVTPKSRRILLGVICHLEIVSNGAAGCSAMLTDLFNAAVTAIAAHSTADPLCLDEENVVFQMCECAWDLTAFSPIIIESLFNCEGKLGSSKLECLRVLTACICRGYQRVRLDDEISPVDIEWNRLRAAFFTLLRASPKLPTFAFDSIEAIIRAECEAINVQCRAGPASSSSIFNDEVVSNERVPTGLFIRLVQELIERSAKEPSNAEALHNCVDVLHKSKSAVVSTIALPCPDPLNFVDPRPTLCEAWLLAMKALADLAAKTQVKQDNALKDLLVESCAVAVSLLFFPVISKRRDHRCQSPCMSFEGPQTLAINEFLRGYFALGPLMLQLVGNELMRRIAVDTEKASSADVGFQSISIIGAALFRAAQGGLPPWAVESAAELYAAFFVALNSSVDAFAQTLLLSMEVRLRESVPAFGSLQPGELLSGPAFDNTKQTAKDQFLKEAVEQSKQDNIAAWKRMKVLLKKISGGKKTETDFTQKPSPTKWEFERTERV